MRRAQPMGSMLEPRNIGLMIRRFSLALVTVLLSGCASGQLVPVAAEWQSAAAGDFQHRSPQRDTYVVVSLNYNHEAELERVADDISDPGSPNFRHFLTPQAFDARYAPTSQQYALVTGTLRRAGFTIVRTYENRASIDASARTATVERFFNTRIDDVAYRRYDDGYVNVRPVRVPAAISPLIRSVELNSVILARASSELHDGSGIADAKRTPAPRPSPTPVGKGRGIPLTGPTYGPSDGWAPRAVADGFDLPVQHGYNGRGVAIGVVAQGEVNTTDLETFFSRNGIVRKARIAQVPVAGGPEGADPTEATLDAETIGALAPGARIRVYEAPNLSNQSLEDAYARVLSDRNIAVVESPFGECDTADPGFVKTTHADAIAAAAIGMTFVAASGDQGSACFNGSTNAIGTQAPASDPYVLGVGGSESIAPLLASTTPCTCPIATPVAWDDHNVEFGGLSGGGVSRVWPLPAYQRNLFGSAQISKTNRNVPDIAFPAVDADITVHGSSEVVDGTSWAAAIATALLAETVRICGRLGDVNPAAYETFKRHGEGTVFLDVTKGFNGGYAPALSRGYHATRGFDDVTGMGMPNGIHFSAALCGKSLERGLLEEAEFFAD
jgi:subtilase family serine protease